MTRDVTPAPSFVPDLPPGPSAEDSPSIPPPPPGPAPVFRPRVAAQRETALDLDGRPAWANLELFRGMPPGAIARLREAMHAVLFQPGETILTQGEEGEDMYLLDSGSVRVSVRGQLHDTHFERVLVAPALFGEMALVTRTARSATVVAEEAVRCLRLDRHSFDELVRKNPQVAAFLTRAVGERLLEAGSIQHVGKYQVIGRLGAGAVATVFEAMNPGLKRPVALKMLSHSLVYHNRFAEQFHQEAQLVAQLDHEHIVRVFDTERAYGTHFIVMEKLSGRTLDDIIQAGVRLAWGTVRRILREIATALAFSHERGLLHRDIKPSNVFLTDEDRRVKLLDFGIATSAAQSASSEGEHLLGTPYYMSPEQILGRQLDGRSDLYSLGVLAYELITHEVPFDGDTIDELMVRHLKEPTPDMRRLVPDVPDDLIEFVLKATAKNPGDRFESCSAAVEYLRQAAELPVVHRIELSTLAISYHPSRRQMVADALEELHKKLDGVPGIALLHAHQKSLEPARD